MKGEENDDVENEEEEDDDVEDNDGDDDAVRGNDVEDPKTALRVFCELRGRNAIGGVHSHFIQKFIRKMPPPIAFTYR